MTPVAVLVGPPGAGKTTIGQKLAERLGVEFRDVDHDIEATAGKPISDIFLDDGEEAFRALEVEAVAAALDTHDGVLALGGGAVLSPVTRQRLKQHRVVYLEVGLSDAVSRVGLAKDRPVLALGGGAVLSPVTRERLGGHRVVYLEVGLSDAVSRVGLAKDRPVLALNPRATLRYLLDQRRPLYEEVAAITAVTDSRTPEDITDEVAKQL